MGREADTGAGQSQVLARLVAGGLSGCAAKTATAPLDRLKILLQTRHEKYTNVGVWEGLRKIYMVEGAKGYFKGNGAQMVRIFPYAAVQFYSYDYYRLLLPRLAGRESEPLRFLSGSLAGVSAVACTYPLDLVRARLAFQVETRYYTGIGNALSTIYREEGLRGFYKGVVPTVLGMIPYAGVSFFVFGSIKNHLMTHPSLRKDEHRLIAPANMAAGAVAGIMAQTVSYPLDVTRRTMQINRTAREPMSTWQTMKDIYNQHGLRRGLFRGLSLNWIREAPQIAVAFTVHELLKDLLGINIVRSPKG